jgi:hypothetical protein
MCEVCAKNIVSLLDIMEKDGEFEGLTDEEKEVERMALGMRLRANMKCSKNENQKTTN